MTFPEFLARPAPGDDTDTVSVFILARPKILSKGPIFPAGADRPTAEMARLTLKTSCGTIELEQGG